MKKRAQVQRARSGPFLPTGHHCPHSGWWTPTMTGEEARYLSEGTVMPTAGGLPAVWTPAAGPTSSAPAPKAPNENNMERGVLIL
jgi:hypothetical protein